MANVHEMTFRALQMDERYKKLERTLKMVLLKNTDKRNPGIWPSVSSINGDNYDTSSAAMSTQSYGVSSEVVASSANFRNATQLCKKPPNSPEAKIVTSSENQFSINKDATEDRAMMPPPSTPGSWFTRSKRLNEKRQRSTLHNMSLNPSKNNNGFAVSTPASSVFSIIKQKGCMSIDSNAVYQGDDKYGRSVYQENTSDNGSQCRQRIFSRWRVLINDKGLLIIKGTLECGKIARSKPVIRRLTSTSVQSVFKHTYHLQGNLIDERNELPDYVRGKFFNGFPDDWENVYQVWRNYLSDGSKLSFHWPTAVTDSDDEIKSEITEISYNSKYDKYKKSVLRRKHAGSSKASSFTRAIIEKDVQNQLYQNQCSRSHNASLKSPENSHRIHVKRNRDEDVMNVTLEEKKKVHETSIRSLSTTDTVGTFSLKDILQEDKLNIIIDNLTNKTCSIEYIKKVVEMFEGVKYLVSYQSTDENNSDKNSSVSQDKKMSRRPKKENRSREGNRDSLTAQSSKYPLNNLHKPTTKIDRYDIAPSAFTNGGAARIAEKSYEGQHAGQSRRKLTKRKNDSSESENDCQHDNRRPTTYRLPNCHEKMRRSHRLNKSYQSATETEKSFEGSHRARKCNVPSSSRRDTHDSSLSEEEPVVDRRVEDKMQHKRTFASPRKCIVAEKNYRRRVNHHDSSISITDDEPDYVEKPKPKHAYDSNVEGSSISEDEHEDTIVEGRRLEALKYHPVSNSRPVEPHSSENVDNCSDRKKPESSKHLESIFRPVDPVTSRKTSRQETPRETPAFAEPMAVDRPARNPVQSGEEINNFVAEQDDDSAYLSSEIKRAKKSESNCDVVETDPSKAYIISCSNDQQLNQASESSELPAPKSKILQVRKKPIVVSSEPTNINLNSLDWLRSSGGKKNDKNTDNTLLVSVDRSGVNPASNDAKNAALGQKTPVDTLPQSANIAGPTITKSTNKETNVALNAQDSRSSTKENRSEKAGSQINPKLLTAWVPVVVCDNKGHPKYHLIFEGKLLNEAGHVVNRKFATDFIHRRVTPKLVETINQEFYKLVGDLNDTKHVVPKELVKLCRTGCPSRISQFCEKWKNLIAELSKDQLRDRPHNTTLDYLGVPTSSRGRSILPPLKYWAGERIATKDNKAFYSPGNVLQLTIPSSLKNTTDDISDKESPSKAKRVQNSVGQNGKRTDESKATETKRKEVKKVTSSKPAMQNPSQPERRRSSRGGKRMLPKNVEASSSESEEDDKTKPILRKRKARTIDQMLNTETTPTKNVRRSSRNNTASSQNLKSTHASSGRGSFRKLPETELKSKLRKRKKIDCNRASPTSTTSKQFPTRRQSMITCTYYQNVSIRDDDLSQDELSMM